MASLMTPRLGAGTWPANSTTDTSGLPMNNRLRHPNRCGRCSGLPRTSIKPETSGRHDILGSAPQIKIGHHRGFDRWSSSNSGTFSQYPHNTPRSARKQLAPAGGRRAAERTKRRWQWVAAAIGLLPGHLQGKIAPLINQSTGADGAPLGA